MKFWTKTDAVFNRIVSVLAILCIVLLVFAWLSVNLEVVLRYFFNRPQIWVVEVTEYILVFAAFMGAAWVLKEEGHTVIDVALSWLKPGHQSLVNVITSVMGAIICLIITWYSAETVVDHFQRNIFMVKALQLPKAPFLIIIVLGSFLLSIQFLRRAYGYLVDWKQGKIKERGLAAES